jgi:hypothetical protein
MARYKDRYRVYRQDLVPCRNSVSAGDISHLNGGLKSHSFRE